MMSSFFFLLYIVTFSKDLLSIKCTYIYLQNKWFTQCVICDGPNVTVPSITMASNNATGLENILRRMKSTKETELQQQLRKALDGDQEADQFLAIKSQKVTFYGNKAMTWQNLCNDFHLCSVTYMAAKKLGLAAIRLQTEMSMSYLTWLARHHFKAEFDKRALKARKEEIMESMLILSQDVPPTKMRNELHQQSSDSEEEEERSPRKRRRQMIESDSEEEKEEGGGEPPAAEAGEGEPPAAEAGEGEPPAEAEGNQPSAKVVKPKRKRIHHNTSRCRVPGCAFKGQDLIRHLRRVHLKKGEITEEEMPGFNKIMIQGNKARRPRSQGQRSQGRLKKWCLVEGWDSLVSYLTKHLRRAHKLEKGSAELANMTKEAKSYKGLSELHVVSSDEEPPVPQAPTLALKKKAKSKKAKKEQTPPSPPSSSEEEEEEEKEEEEEPEHHGVPDPEEVAEDPSEDHETSDDASPESESPESESDESEETAETQEAYFNATSYRNYRHHWLCGFFSYLTLPDAGNKKTDGRLQHARQVEIILEAIDKGGDDITPLANQGGDIVWLSWAKPAMDNRVKAPGTIISYLTSLEKFLTFVTSSKYHTKDMPPLSPS